MCGVVHVSVLVVSVVCRVARKVVLDVLCSSYWGLRRVLCYEPGAPSLDDCIEVTGSVHCCPAELADLFPYVVFLCLPVFV